jgi:hypothetical protein
MVAYLIDTYHTFKASCNSCGCVLFLCVHKYSKHWRVLNVGHY